MREEEGQGKTYQFVKHHEKSHSSDLHRIPLTGDDQFTYSLRLETSPPCATADAVWRRPSGEGKRTVYNGDVRESLRSNFVETSTDLWFERRLRRGKIEKF